MSKATVPYQRKYFSYVHILQDIKHEKWLLYWDMEKVVYTQIAFSIYGAEMYWYICIQQRVKKHQNKYLKHSKDYWTKLICAYERVKCLCMSELNDNSPLEV